MSDSHQSDPPSRTPSLACATLENDIIFERFFSRYEHDLTDADVGALSRLLDLSDNDLMDLLLARKEPEGDLTARIFTGCWRCCATCNAKV